MLEWLFVEHPVTIRDVDFRDVCKPVMHILRECAQFVNLSAGHKGDEKSLQAYLDDAQILCDVAWEQINTGHWKDVSLCWRNLYSYGALFKAYLEVQMEKPLSDALRTCDMGLLMGAPIMGGILTRVASELHTSLDIKLSREKVKKALTQCSSIAHEEILFPVARAECPSVENFMTEHMQKEEPVVIMKAIDYWPAFSSKQWSVERVVKVAGGRTVPVEIGARYTEETWSQKLMTIVDFVEKYMLSDEGTEEVGYLAQHQLFDQIPELRDDICIPTYCSISEKDEEPDINVWFGPKGTVSPLHHDPKQNLLTQIFGGKYVRLYRKEETEHLYPYESRLLENTSQVDVENPDLDKFPSFGRAKYSECVLCPGEMLYIPPKCWHFVKSLSPSLSISFWWE